MKDKSGGTTSGSIPSALDSSTVHQPLNEAPIEIANVADFSLQDNKENDTEDVLGAGLDPMKEKLDQWKRMQATQKMAKGQKASVLASKSVNILQPLTEHKLGTKAPKRLAEDLNGKDIRKKVKPPLRNPQRHYFEYSESKNAASDEALPGLVTLPKANTEETERVDASADLATALSALQERKSDTALCDGRQPLCDEVELLRDKLQIESQHVDAMRRMLADEATLRSDLEKRLADTISKAESWRMQWEGVRQDLIAKERELESMRASNCNPVSRPPRSTEVPDFPVTNSPRYCSAENLVNQALGDGNHGRAAIGEVALASLLARLQGPNKNELRDVSRWISDLRGEIKDCYKVITELESLPTTVEGLRNEVRDCYAVIEALEGQMADLTAERKGKPAEKSFTWVNIQTQTPMTDCTVGNTEGAVAKFHLLRVASSIREQEHEEEQLRNLKEISDLSLSLLNAEEMKARLEEDNEKLNQASNGRLERYNLLRAKLREQEVEAEQMRRRVRELECLQSGLLQQQ